jgi:multidrug resistance efflux pump
MARHLLQSRMQPPPIYRRAGFVTLVTILLVAASAIGLRYWLASDQQSTDKAFIEAAAGDAGRVSVLANFKRTQLAGIRPGQSATITVPEYPDQVYRGHVDGIDRAAARAGGPRVPVRIVVDQPPDPGRPLGPGMPVIATVILR